MGLQVLVVDDDRSIRDSLERVLALDGYRVSTAGDGAEALNLLAQSVSAGAGSVVGPAAATGACQAPDLLILDLMMPGIDGLEVCRHLRAAGDRTPILMLTARGDTGDRVAGLDAGADDYLPKPFDPAELLARVRALLRRATDPAASNGSEDPVVEVADLRLDVAARRVWRADVELQLSKTEFELLELLMRNAGMVLDRSEIYDRIWGYDFGPESRNLSVYVGYLRRKVDDGHTQPLIHTVRGIGYSLRAS